MRRLVFALSVRGLDPLRFVRFLSPAGRTKSSNRRSTMCGRRTEYFGNSLAGADARSRCSQVCSLRSHTTRLAGQTGGGFARFRLLGAARNGAILGGLSRSHSARQLNRNGSLTPISLDLNADFS